MMANSARGECHLRIDGRLRVLFLTMGGLARLQTAFGAGDLAALALRMRALSPADVPVLIAALIDDGGPADPEALAFARYDLAEAATAIALAFDRAFA